MQDEALETRSPTSVDAPPESVASFVPGPKPSGRSGLSRRAVWSHDEVALLLIDYQ